MNLEEGATTILRNGQIGGHAAGQPAGEEDPVSPLRSGES